MKNPIPAIKVFLRTPTYRARFPCRCERCAELVSMVVRSRRAARPADVWICFAKPALQLLVFGNGQGAARTTCGGRAVVAHDAVIANVRIELDDRAGGEQLHLRCGTGNRAVAEI